MRAKSLSLKVTCPTCGACPRRRCELSTGGFRTESHRLRKDLAGEKAAQGVWERKRNRAYPVWMNETNQGCAHPGASGLWPSSSISRVSRATNNTLDYPQTESPTR